MKKEVIYRTSDGYEFESQIKADRHIKIMEALDQKEFYAPVVYKILINNEVEPLPDTIKLLLMTAELGTQHWVKWDRADTRRLHDEARRWDTSQ